MGVNGHGDQAILIHTLNNFLTPSAALEMEFSPSAPPETELASETYFKDELECIVCMDTQVILCLNITLLWMCNLDIHIIAVIL